MIMDFAQGLWAVLAQMPPPAGRLALICSLAGLALGFAAARFAGRYRRGQSPPPAPRQGENGRRALSEAIESISEGFALFDAEDRLLLCNDKARSILGLGEQAQDGIGHTFTELLHRAVASGHLCTDTAPADWIAARLERHRHAEGASEHRLGDKRWFRLSERRTRDGGTVIVYTDITADKIREGEIARQGELLKATFDNMADGILIFDKELRIVAWNRRFVELTQIRPSFLSRPGASFYDIITLNFRSGEYGTRPLEKVLAAADSTLARGKPVCYERTRPDGTIFRRRVQPLPGGGLVSIYSDITQSRRAEAALRNAKEQAESASRAKSEFLANMSHELRTPLNAIIGFSEIIRDQILGPIATRRYIEYAGDINDSGTHLLSLINDILDLSKAEAGRLVLNEETVDIGQVAESCLRLIRDRAERSGIALTTSLPAGLRVLADARMMKQILLNLLSNATKFTPTGGRIEVTGTLSPEGAVVLRIADTGIGMAESDIPRALEAFAQVDSALNRKHEGTGLGLPLSKMLIELHGGKLAIASKVDYGTIVTVTLPPERVLREVVPPALAQQA